MAKKVSEGTTAEAANPIATDQGGVGAVPSDPAANAAVTDTAQLDAHAPDREDQGGASDLETEKLIAAGRAPSAQQLGQIDDFLKGEQDKFRSAYPKLSAAIDAWQESGKPAPTGVRIVSRIDGFRRAGLAHSKEAVVHPIGTTFKGPEQLEGLFAEPNLSVEFV